MRRHKAIALLGLAMAGMVCAKGPNLNPAPRRSTDLPRPRDGDAAVQEELDTARRARTAAAYDLFIGRHSDHPLAEVARHERAHLLKPGR